MHEWCTPRLMPDQCCRLPRRELFVVPSNCCLSETTTWRFMSTPSKQLTVMHCKLILKPEDLQWLWANGFEHMAPLMVFRTSSFYIKVALLEQIRFPDNPTSTRFSSPAASLLMCIFLSLAVDQWLAETQVLVADVSKMHFRCLKHKESMNMDDWLVVWTPEKYESQLGWLFPIYGNIKNGNQTTNQMIMDDHGRRLLIWIIVMIDKPWQTLKKCW